MTNFTQLSERTTAERVEKGGKVTIKTGCKVLIDLDEVTSVVGDKDNTMCTITMRNGYIVEVAESFMTLKRRLLPSVPEVDNSVPTKVEGQVLPDTGDEEEELDAVEITATVVADVDTDEVSDDSQDAEDDEDSELGAADSDKYPDAEPEGDADQVEDPEPEPAPKKRKKGKKKRKKA